MPTDPFDRWVTPEGGIAAEFYREEAGFLVRFPGQADFRIAATDGGIAAIPAVAEAPVDSLYNNSIVPLLGNHAGGLHLHGSAVASPAGALAFMGLSRRGKTTLAGAFARAGHPFLTEDVLTLERTGEAYSVLPQRPVLRLFADSATFLFGGGAGDADKPSCAAAPVKAEIVADTLLPHAGQPAPLRAIFVLGPGTATSVTIESLPPSAALAQLIQHAFVLDVEDKPRLRGHFERIAALAASVPCHQLDYPRSYAQLPGVIDAVLREATREDQTRAID